MIWETIIFILCMFIHLLCCIEIIGSYYLTKKLHGIKLVNDNQIFPIICPLASPIWAYAIISEAQEAYEKGVIGNYYPQESLLEYIKHGFVGYIKWNERKKVGN